MKVHLGYLLAFSALALAACAAFFSVYGLSHMFAGAALSVILMASTLEVSKLVIATYLHSYWNKMNKLMKVYLSSGLVILALITSLGIYGYLSNAYQITANKMELFDGDVGVVQNKIALYQSKIDANNKSIETKTKRMDQLMTIRGQQEDRLNTNNNRSNRSATSLTNNDINIINKEIDELNKTTAVYTDSISKFNSVILDKKTNNTVAGEVSTLKYMSDITGLPMSQIVNIFILLIVFVFDPLAICLVIATNSVFNDKRNNKSKEPEQLVDEIEPIIDTPQLISDKIVPVQPMDKPSGESIVTYMDTVETKEVADIKSEIEDTIPSPDDFTPTTEIEPIVEKSPEIDVQQKLDNTIENKTGIKYNQIREIRNREQNKQDRGFSKPIPNRTSNGSNRVDRI